MYNKYYNIVSVFATNLIAKRHKIFDKAIKCVQNLLQLFENYCNITLVMANGCSRFRKEVCDEDKN